MKISKAQKEKNRIAILEAAVKLSEKEPFKSVSMKAIAGAAGLSDAAIYKYFPTKEEILTGYFEARFQQTVAAARASKEYSDLDFKTRVQWIVEKQLELMAEDESFVEQAFHQLFVQPMALAQTGVGESRKLYVAFMTEEIEAAVARDEFATPPFTGFLCEILWDLHVGAVYYWLKDDSKAKINTSQVIELGLNVMDELLKGELMSKAYHLAHFLFKEHLLSKLFKLGVPGVR